MCRNSLKMTYIWLKFHWTSASVTESNWTHRRSDGQTIAFLSEPKSRSILIFVCVTPSLTHSAPFYEIASKFLI